MDDSALTRRVSELRDDFDATFAEASRETDEAPQRFLAIAANGLPYAFRLSEISGVAVDRRATPVPGPLPELLGLTGVRGHLVPVYSLAALLGVPPPASPPRWLVLLEQEQLALAIEHLEGYVFGRRDDVMPSSSNDAGHCPETLRLEKSSFGILSVPSLVKRITARVASVRPREEH
jgi:chemotaxis signal transduction protein